MVENFEKEFAAFCHTEYAVAVNSGTDALRFALIAAGVKSGDVVVTVPNTFIATTEAISQVGALPEFVDIDERTYNIDPAKLRSYLEEQCTLSEDGGLFSRRSKRPVTAIVPVHLYGQMADMDPILELATQRALMVVEDACQAHGAEYFSRKQNRWFRAGSMGRAAAFSFYPAKNLGACGEGGAITTNDARLAATCVMLRDHGQTKKYYHDIEGYNGRLDSIQTGILSVKLKYLEGWNAKRRERATEYNRLLATSGAGTRTPYEPSWSRAVYHLYVIRTADRELPDGAFGEGRHRRGNSLSDSPTFAEGVCALKLPKKGPSGYGKDRRPNLVAPNVSATNRRAASTDSGGNHSRVTIRACRIGRDGSWQSPL